MRRRGWRCRTACACTSPARCPTRRSTRSSRTSRRTGRTRGRRSAPSARPSAIARGAGLPGVRRLRRLHARAHGLRAAARVEEGARRGRAGAGGRARRRWRRAWPSPRPLGYRNKSKLVYAEADGQPLLGAYAPRSHRVVDLAGCRVAEPPLDDVAHGAARRCSRSTTCAATTSARARGSCATPSCASTTSARCWPRWSPPTTPSPTATRSRARSSPRGPRWSAWCRTSTARAATRSTATRSARSPASRR